MYRHNKVKRGRRGAPRGEGASGQVMSAPPSRPAVGAASLHSRILSDIRSRILSGAWPPGHRIPFEHELSTQYGCSRMTVSKALTELTRSGLIERRRKAGSFVKHPHSQSAVLEIHDQAAEVAALGLAYSFEILTRRKRPATRTDCARLAVQPGDPVLALTCSHDAGGRPFCFEERLINLVEVPDAATEPFDTLSPGAWLLAKVPWTTAEHRIRAEGAEGAIATTLELDQGAPCLIVERRTWLGAQAVTQVKLAYRAEEYELVATFTPAQG
jgi:GntR family histidine utilization transcriptional repressor